MGFLDKLKEVGKGAVKGALLMSAKSYATVTNGKHKLCKITLNQGRDKLIFIKVATIEEECSIKENIKTFSLVGKNDTYSIKIVFNDEESLDAAIIIDKNRGSALPTAEQRVAAQYSDMSEFLEALVKGVSELSEDTKLSVNTIMRYAGKSDIA